MNKKVAVTAVILVIITLIVVYLFAKPPAKEYSDNPSDWIEKGEISVEQATKGKGYINEIGQQYRDENISTVFELEGYYKGKYFTESFVENGKTKMRITTDMKPGDGVIDGFMTEKKEGDIWVVDIFVDEDWKKQVGETNIHWGILYQQEKQFVYNQISTGIYHDQIIDDANRLLENARIRTFGIIVGDITKEDSEGKTVMRLI